MAPTSKQRSSEKTQKKTTPTTRRRIVTRSFGKKEQSLLANESPMKSNFMNLQQPILQQQPQPQQQRKEVVVVVDSDKDKDNEKMIITSSSSSNGEICSTPKSEKYKIPEIMTCPPAPKKPKNSKCLFQKRRPISFFAHPDIDKFFVFAMRDSTNTIKCE